jgi:hypothetical protein
MPLLATVVTMLLMEIAITLAVPAMVVLNPAALPLPIAVVIALSIMPWPNPVGSAISRTRPIPLMPSVMALDRVPIAVNPNIIRTRSYWPNSHYARRWWWANPNSKIHLGRECQSYS